MRRASTEFRDAEESRRTLVRDEGLSKNPIRDRMRIDVLPVPRDELWDMVVRARDFFHTYIEKTVHRAYKRPTIYLVDGWVTQALGYFTMCDQPAGQTASGHKESEEQAKPSVFASTVDLFKALGEYLTEVRGLSVLMIDEHVKNVQTLGVELLADAGKLDDLRDEIMKFMNQSFIVQAILETHVKLQGKVNEAFFERLSECAQILLVAAEVFASGPRPTLRGMSFDPKGFGGVLFENIPELDITAPAIVIAPTRIASWVERMPNVARNTLRAVIDVGTWFGARNDESLPLAVGIANVIAHEMTHAMLRLPNDVAEDHTHRSQDVAYRENPGFEEGIANFVACLTTANALVKSQHGTMNSALPELGKTHRAVYNTFRPLIRWTFEGYHDEPTERFLTAWESNARDFKAFSGMLALFATKHPQIDWLKTEHELQHGVVSTTKPEVTGADKTPTAPRGVQ